jgi:protease I
MRIACLLGPEFEDSEFRVPYDGFRAAGHQVIVVGTRRGELLVGHKGIERVQVEMPVDAADPGAFDALFVPGGRSPDHLRRDGAVVEFVRAWQGRIILATGHGPQLLITADLVRGRTLTAWSTVQVDLRNAGANVLDAEVVVNENLVTSRQPSDLDGFVRESLRLLEHRGARPPAETHAFV